MKKFLGWLLIGIVFLSCTNKKKANGAASSSPSSFADTVDIPEWVVKDPYTQKNLGRLIKTLGLPQLEGGTNGLQIRIWFSCPPRDTQQVISFKQIGTIWEAEFYTYQKKNYKEDGGFEVYNVHRENKQPESGWESFGRKLLETQIKDLPDHSFYGSAYISPTDGNGLAVEVATANKYRQYYYPDLWLNRNLAKWPAKLYKALKLIEKEFNSRIYCL